MGNNGKRVRTYLEAFLGVDLDFLGLFGMLLEAVFGVVLVRR